VPFVPDVPFVPLVPEVPLVPLVPEVLPPAFKANDAVKEYEDDTAFIAHEELAGNPSM
jgi:hypothetical protein